ncbi:hypothetical protein GCM10012275_52930 [Longimycelium tulufanense]|uniref:Uncharacterized protein n=1 Tax=Longimycelium tulufanense TaxID=907463 RepID=A0A8J3FYX5_9PSEU|nr:hypothetical protein [Longimycelium tulufanense]GGM75644.1 hypothetical protein GCM10012275_52930 [Longimycelium tulufanense]
MPTVNIAAGKVGAHGITLSANVETDVQFADDLVAVEVLSHDGAAAVYLTVDGSAPAVEGDNCHVLPAVVGAIQLEPPTYTGTRVRMISAGTPTLSVMRMA